MDKQEPEDFVTSEEYEQKALENLDGAAGDSDTNRAQVYATLALAATIRESTVIATDILEDLLVPDDDDDDDEDDD